MKILTKELKELQKDWQSKQTPQPTKGKIIELIKSLELNDVDITHYGDTFEGGFNYAKDELIKLFSTKK